VRVGSVAAGAGRQYGPRLQSGAPARPLNFTVRRHMRPLLILSAIGLASCSTSNNCPNMHFERLREANRAVIRVDSHAVGAEIRSPDTLSALANFAQTHGSGWGYPWFGPPVARLYVEFYAGTRFLGDFGVGTNYLSAQGCEYFQSRSVSPADRQQLIALIGVGDPYASGAK
jgi:hypothetical protein